MGTGRASTSSPSSWWPSGAAQWVPTLWGGRSTPGPSQHPESLSAHGASALGLRARGGNAEHVAAALASELPHALHTVSRSSPVPLISLGKGKRGQRRWIQAGWNY